MKLRSSGESFAVATVIEVIGSASAKTGSKAIFSSEGKNLLGWIGGGCAERFIGEESKEAIIEKKSRISLADLDDEIFGLGVACGGKMRVFIDPIIPAVTVTLPPAPQFENEIRSLGAHYGWTIKTDQSLTAIQTIEELMLRMNEAIGILRNGTLKSLRLVKNVPAVFINEPKINSSEVTIVGRTRITEAMARHFILLGYSVRAIGPDVKKEDYPSSVQCHCLDESYSSIMFRPQEIVIVASHTAQDPMIVKKALDSKASYVGMIGSLKRSMEVLTYLGRMNQEVNFPLYLPAGLDIDAQNPDEIALSVIGEILSLRTKT